MNDPVLLSADEHAIVVAFRAVDPALRDWLRKTIVRGVRLVATVNRDAASRELREFPQSACEREPPTAGGSGRDRAGQLPKGWRPMMMSLDTVFVRLQSRLELAAALIDEITWNDGDGEGHVREGAETLLQATIDAALTDVHQLQSLPADVLNAKADIAARAEAAQYGRKAKAVSRTEKVGA